MEKDDKTRAHRSVMYFGILMASIYAICVTIFMVILYRFTVVQATRIQDLETVTGELAARVDILQNSFTARTTNKKSVGETDRVSLKKPSPLINKLMPSDTDLRDKRQLEGYCPCLQGPRGSRGKRGKRGHKGDQGPKGDLGPSGPVGPQGPHGENGSSGVQGLKGEPGANGAQGLHGEKGEAGLQGAEGQPGPRGPAGPLVSESIHLIGDGKRIRIPAMQRIVAWRLKHKEGSIVYHASIGIVEIQRAGYYYIYSQMYYYDGTTMLMGHFTYIDGKKVMESMGTVISDRKMYNTKYHGGVFLLRVNDTISVRVPFTKKYNMDEEGSFFGAFLLHRID